MSALPSLAERRALAKARLREGGGGGGGGLKAALRAARKSGVLSLASRGLSDLPDEVFHPADHLDPGEKFWECVEMTKVDFSFNELRALSEDIAELSGLTSLKLRGNKLAALPTSICNLRALVSLDVSGNELQSLPEALGSLASLRELNASSNHLGPQIPDSLCSISSLQALALDSNKKLAHLPEDLGCLTSLTKLTVANCSLGALPPSLRCLTQLQVLDVKGNALGSIDISANSNLTILDACDNKLEYFPSLPLSTSLARILLSSNSIESLDEVALGRVQTSIVELHLKGNRVRELPDALGRLQLLRTLDLSCNNIGTLPSAVGYMHSLERLALSGNPLRTVRQSLITGSTQDLKKYLRTRGPPPAGLETGAGSGGGGIAGVAESEVCDAVQTKTLDFRGRNLESIPQSMSETIHHLDGIVRLHLGSNRLSVLPGELLARCTGLQELNADKNCLSAELPAELVGFGLRQLSLAGNALSAAHFRALRPPGRLFSALQDLNLSSNKLSSVPPELFRCKSLRILSLALNQLSNLSALPWCALGSLETLDLSDNHIADIGDVVAMTWLRNLVLSNNDLATIPAELGFMAQMESLSISGNPQRFVRQGVLDKGTACVLEYLRMRLPADSAPPEPRCLPGPDF